MNAAIIPSSGRRMLRGFTLVELMVVLVILAILASLTLAGLAVAQHRSKVDKTRSTIRKLHEIVVPHYESYLRRRVPFTASGDARQNATNRLVAIRRLMVREMPDNWNDVFDSVTAVNALTGGDSFLATGPVRAYASRKTIAGNPQFQSSECLYLIVSRGLQEPDALEQFRADEIGDTDGDGAPEFHDGWRQSIMFVRWPVGFRSIIQSQNAGVQPDPFDPSRVSTLVNYPSGDQRDYAVVPLICSAGVDGNYGVSTGTTVWSSAASLATIRIETGTTAPGTVSFPDATDNITNHDLTTK